MDKTRLAWFLALLVSYWVFADFGIRWAVTPAAGSPIWPAAGVALALMVLAGGRSWLWLAPAVFVGRMLAFATDGHTEPVWLQLVVSAGNTASASLGAVLLVDRERFHPALHRLRDILWLALWGALASSLVAAVVGAVGITLAYGAKAPTFPLAALIWWVGNVGGVLVITPAILAWSCGDPLPRSWRTWAHLAVVVLVASALTWLVLVTEAHEFLRTWTIFPIIIWAALALNVRGVSVTLVAVSIVGMLGMAQTPGFLGSDVLGDPGFVLIQQFVTVAAVSGLVLAVVADERRGREALARSEGRLRRVLESPLVGVAVGDTEGRLRFVNDAFLHLTGLTRAETRRVRWNDMTPPEWLPFDRVAMAQISREGVAQPYEKVYQRPDGTRVPVLVHLAALPDEPGLMVAFVLDQTEQRAARDALRATVERLAFLTSLTDAVRDLPDPEQVSATAIDRLGRHLGARCTWREGDSACAWLVRSALGPRAVETVRRGEPVATEQVVCAGLAHQGRLRAVLLVESSEPRCWQDHEVQLVCDVVERVWGHVDRVSNLRSLEESEERLRLAQGAAGMGVFEWRSDGGVLWTEGLEALYGLASGSFEGTREAWLRRVAPEDRERVVANIQQAMDCHQEIHGAEYRIVLPDGSRRWIASLAKLFYDDHGQPRRVLGVNIDIHERKVAEEALREQEERLRSALAGGKMGAWDWNVREDTVAWDARQYELWGLHPTRFGSQLTEALEAIVPADRIAVREALTAAVAGRVPVDMEFRVRHEQTVRWLHAMGRPLFDAEDNVTRVVGVTFDVTDRKRAEADREAVLQAERTARAEAEALNRLKDEFLATLSHELRTPLHAMLGYAGLLQKPGVSQEMLEKGLAAIERGARTQAQLVEDLLDMSRIVSGKLRLELVPLDPSATVHAAVETMRPTAEARGVQVEEDVDPAVGLVSADAHRLQQIAWNLLSNALKFTPSGGRVRVSLHRDDHRMLLAVEDTGIGIPGDFLPYVFERFRQVDGSSTRQHGGLGLGLGIVKQLVELHGGEIRAESPGRDAGATFTVELPLLELTTSVSEAPERGEEVRLDDLEALVVDDDEEGRELVRRLLEDCGAHVTTAASAEEALDLVPRMRPDVIVSDIGMPGLDGYGMLRRLRTLDEAQGGRTPAVALTAYARTPDRQQALDAGFQDHLAKPVDPARLTAVVAQLVR